MRRCPGVGRLGAGAARSVLAGLARAEHGSVARNKGGSKPTDYIFRNVTSIVDHGMQTTVQNNKSYLYTREIEETYKP